MRDAPRRRLVGARVMYLNDGPPSVGIEYRLDERGAARVVAGAGTLDAILHECGYQWDEGMFEGRLAKTYAGEFGVPYESGRLYTPEEGAQFLVGFLADNWSRGHYWGEAIVVEDGVERVIGGPEPVICVLIACGDPVVRELVAGALNDARHSWQKVYDGAAALDALRNTAFSVVVADLSLPPRNGLDLLALITTTSDPPPLIVVVHDGASEARVMALSRCAARVHDAGDLDVARLVADVEALGAARRVQPW